MAAITDQYPIGNRHAGAAPFSGPALRGQAEAALHARVAPWVPSQEAATPQAIEQTLHELSVHQIELEMQNEELQRRQAELNAANRRYFDLYDMAPVGYLTLGDAFGPGHHPSD